jgi:hypothetical protein
VNVALVIGWLAGFFGMFLMFVTAAKRNPPPRRWMWVFAPIVSLLWPLACIVAMVILIVEIVTDEASPPARVREKWMRDTDRDDRPDE